MAENSDTDTGTTPAQTRTGKTLPPIPPLPSYQEQRQEIFRRKIARNRPRG